jgi:hypothetical protein
MICNVLYMLKHTVLGHQKKQLGNLARKPRAYADHATPKTGCVGVLLSFLDLLHGSSLARGCRVKT